MQPISPCLWFADNAEEAVSFYLSVFPRGRVISKTYYSEGAPAPAGSIMTITFEINGCEFTALNGGPYFSFSPAVSFMIACENQQEIDFYWDKLCNGGKPEQCGWLKDRFGVSWQLVPRQLMALMVDGEKHRITKMTAALLQMQKLDIAALLAAYEN